MTPASIQSIGIEDHVMPSTTRPETLITREISSEKPHNIPSTSNTDVASILVELNMHAPVRRTWELINNLSNVGSIRILPPRSEKVSLKSLIDSQSRMLRLLPYTLEKCSNQTRNN